MTKRPSGHNRLQLSFKSVSRHNTRPCQTCTKEKIFFFYCSFLLGKKKKGAMVPTCNQCHIPQPFIRFNPSLIHSTSLQTSKFYSGSDQNGRKSLVKYEKTFKRLSLPLRSSTILFTSTVTAET